MTEVLRLHSEKGDALVRPEQVVAVEWFPHVLMGPDARLLVHVVGGVTIREDAPVGSYVAGDEQIRERYRAIVVQLGWLP